VDISEWMFSCVADISVAQARVIPLQYQDFHNTPPSLRVLPLQRLMVPETWHRLDHVRQFLLARLRRVFSPK